ncbi:hypothetical protein [Veillonella magna]|uniref:hypothetical protein n=1 Tax=Veillonella magna TaxID=464322 RepID=UPI0026665793|nr:hypothetical protein [Veillonella magna]
MKYRKWIVFAFVAIGAIVSQFFVQQRYTSLLQVGSEYQWPVSISRRASWIPSDYLHVTFLGAQGPWMGERAPVEQQEAYVVVVPKPSGLLTVKEVTPHRPDSGEYILARITRYENGIAEFQIPFDRVKVDLSKVNPQFYKGYKGTLLATLKVKDGHGVVTGVYSKGVSIEIAKPGSIEEQERDSRIPLEELGNGDDKITPPVEE